MNQFKNAFSSIMMNVILMTLISYSLSFAIKSIITDETKVSNIFDRLWIFDYRNYVFTMIIWLVLLTGLMIGSSIRQTKNRVRSFFRFNAKSIVVSISIFLSIMTIGMTYPAIPSISNYNQKAEDLLNNSIEDVSKRVEDTLRIGDYNYLNDTFIKSQYTLGHMHFRLVPSDNIKNNLSLLTIGDYAPIELLETIESHGDFSLNDGGVFSSKDHTLSLRKSSSVFWEYQDAGSIQKTNSVGFSVEIAGSVNSCYTFYYQFQRAGVYSYPISKDKICLYDANTHQITMNINSLEHQGKAEGLKFTIEPDANNRNTEDRWVLSSAKIFLDKSGRGKINALGYCLEGIHDGIRDKVIHLQDGTITAGPCSGS